MDVLNIELRPLGISFTLQVGLHSGGAIAGIIGHKTFQYDLCGDAVNTSARMCSYSKPGHVHVSDVSYKLLSHRYPAIARTPMEIKGKGLMQTYYLLNMPADTSALESGMLTLGSSARDVRLGPPRALPGASARIGAPDVSSIWPDAALRA